ncbi:MAG: hypothetical protein IPG98_18285 [Burkholderiales bacterium]|nr:hypothetical protein [Burkholderiales bacterium]
MLGLSTENIEGFTYRINLKLKDLGDPEAAGYMDKVWQMVNEAISKGSNEMAERILGTWTETTETVSKTIRDLSQWDEDNMGYVQVTETIKRQTYTASEYAREGERAIDTLTRLATPACNPRMPHSICWACRSWMHPSPAATWPACWWTHSAARTPWALRWRVLAALLHRAGQIERHAPHDGDMSEALALRTALPSTVAEFRALDRAPRRR